MKAERRELDTSILVTVDETVVDFSAFRGQFVRVRPTQAATDKGLKKFKRQLLDAGAVAVRLLPKPTSDAVALSGVASKVLELTAGRDELPPVRELCEALVDQSSSKHKAEVKSLLNDLADKVGL